MALTTRDPYSHSRPDQIAVISTSLELSVNFEQNVLEGQALINIAKIDLGCDKLILDTYGLVIFSVKYCYYGARGDLVYHLDIENESSIFGTKLTITIPNMDEITPQTTAKKARTTYYDDPNKFIIQINYKTSPNSPALYWLKPEQTSDGTHHLLISNTKLTYARAIFPCQDTPSHKSDFYLEISVPKVDPEYTVLMPYKLFTYITKSTGVDSRMIHKGQVSRIPSYAMYIIVGSLKNFLITFGHEHLRFNLWAEKKYIQQNKMALEKTMPMWRTLRNLYDFVGQCNVCVLPPNVPEFDMQCPSMTFLSSTFLTNIDDSQNDRLYQSMKNITVQNILESWIVKKITIVNFQHLWLIKGFSKFICRDSINNIIDGEAQNILKNKSLNNLKNMADDNSGFTLELKPGVLPKNMINYVSEKGYLFLCHLQSILSNRADFIRFVQHFLANCLSETESLTTDQFKTHLCRYFTNAGVDYDINVLTSANWNEWFKEPGLPSEYHTSITINCHNDALWWINHRDASASLPLMLDNLKEKNDIIKIEFLSYLHAHASPAVLTPDRLHTLKYAIVDDLKCNNCEIRFIWYRLCLKNRAMSVKVANEALDFAYKLYAKYACPIFRDVYEQTETQKLAERFMAEKKTRAIPPFSKMLPETIKELDPIFNVRENS